MNKIFETNDRKRSQDIGDRTMDKLKIEPGEEKFAQVHYIRAELAEQEENFNEAFLQYELAATKGHLEALNRLGICYLNGIGCQQSLERAVSCFRTAAKQGVVDAQYHLANCYMRGEGVGQDCLVAVRWYMKAGTAGNADAQNALGICYEHGLGVTKNLSEAVNWYCKAAEQRHTAARSNLADCYFYGKGVESNPEKACQIYSEVAEDNYAQAQYMLGYCYQHGKGVAQNLQSAYLMYQRAAQQGYAEAQYALAICYMKGLGVEQSKRDMVQWLSKAARQGHINAQFSLCPCYQYGIGTRRNAKHMAYWFKRAASGCIKKGDAEAMCKLGHAHLNRDIVGEILLDEAKKCFQYALKLDAECADAHFGLGEVCYYQCIMDADQSFRSKTVAVLRKITAIFTPVEIFGSGDASERKQQMQAEPQTIKTFLQTPEGKFMVEHYQSAAGCGHTLAQKRIEELKNDLL